MNNTAPQRAAVTVSALMTLGGLMRSPVERAIDARLPQPRRPHRATLDYTDTPHLEPVSNRAKRRREERQRKEQR